MALYFITGAPGAGKTAVTHELLRRGQQAYDTDDPHHTGIAGWHDKTSGEYIAGFNEIEVTEGLLKTSIWRLTDKALADFALRSSSEPIFLCGRLRDARRVIDLSRQVFFLAASPDTIRNRLSKRSQIPGEVEWGREAWQIDLSVEVNAQIEEEYLQLGAVIIDSNQELTAVVDAILGQTS